MLSLPRACLSGSSLLLPPLLLLLAVVARAEVCPSESAASATADDASHGAAKRPLAPKSCPDFKDDTDQNQCCPSRITYGSFYCCTPAQKQQIQSDIAAELRRRFVKKYLAALIIAAIVLGIATIVVASIVCKRVRFCPLHQSKDSCKRGDALRATVSRRPPSPLADTHSNASFQLPSGHAAPRFYRPIDQQAPPPQPQSGQQRHPAMFAGGAALSTPSTLANKSLYDAPPPYEQHAAYRPLVGGADGHQPAPPLQSGVASARLRQENCILENQLNCRIERRSSADVSSPAAATAAASTPPHTPSNE